MTKRVVGEYEAIQVRVPKRLYMELAAEAWVMNQSLSRYVCGLLSRRGRWQRTMGAGVRYDLIAETEDG
jgi:hypothetical protein